LGVSYAKEGNHEKALSAFDYCLIIDEDYLLARFNKANELVELKRYEEALQEYYYVIEKDGPDSITYCNIAGCLERMGSLAEAREYYQKSTRLNPNLAEAWFGIGLTFEKELKMKEAVNYYKRALIMEPENTEYILSLAECEYQLGNLEESEECYQLIIALEPEQMEAWLDWSYVMFNDNREEEAIDLLTEAIKIEPNCHQYYYRLTTYLYKTGKTKSALQYLELGLLINFKEHFLLFEYAPELAQANEVLELIETFRDKYEE
jgi:tetratricopeptide (TPR) repeat protein